MAAASQPPDRPSLFSAELHEIGARLVDLMNQTGFLYRFPSFAGVTLACIVQHVDPLRRLLQSVEPRRVAAGRDESPDGYSAGDVGGPDPLVAAYDHALRGLDAFLAGLAEVVKEHTERGGSSAGRELSVLARICAEGSSVTPAAILEIKDAIDECGERAAARALRRFQPLTELEWQNLRMVIFYFLLNLQRSDG
ncbi:MAG: hypothetical protein HOP29_13695 [Phycisphaerales bacterium]|nr:hypothetical protein [Phycisphaerales bacterium]